MSIPGAQNAGASDSPSRSLSLDDVDLSLCQLLDPAVMADPYPLYARLREQDPVHWDPFLKAWVVTRYADALSVLHRFSAARAPSPEDCDAVGCSELSPIARVMTKQLLFLDGPAHARLRSLAAEAFSPRRVQVLRERVQGIVDQLIDGILNRHGDGLAQPGLVELLSEFAEPFPAIVTAEILGVPVPDHARLKAWSLDFGRMLGSIHHAAEFSTQIVRSVNEAAAYFRNAIRDQAAHPREGLVHALATAEIDGARLTEEEVIANCLLVTVGAQEEVTNLIGNGMLTLLRHPETIGPLVSDAALMAPAVEELLRFESPTQQTMRVAPEDVLLGGRWIRKREQVIVLLAAANRDPDRFAHPQALDLARKDNRHLAFGWAAHFCFGAALARAEGQIAIASLLRRLPQPSLDTKAADWRTNLSLRGLRSLPVRFNQAAASESERTRA